MHSAIIYKTWNFKQDAWPALCSVDDEPVAQCRESCLTDLNCLGGADYFDGKYSSESGPEWDDLLLQEPDQDLFNDKCPDKCCGRRRMCMRTHDILGNFVPFDREMLLIYGGRTYSHEYDKKGRLIFHKCEEIFLEQSDDSEWPPEEWRGCLEPILDEMWIYDTVDHMWTYVKPDSSLSQSGQYYRLPSARFAHDSVLIKRLPSQSVLEVNQQFMFMLFPAPESLTTAETAKNKYVLFFRDV